MGKLLFFPDRHSTLKAESPEVIESNLSNKNFKEEDAELESSNGASAHAIALMEEAAELLESLGGAEREAGWILEDLVRMLSGKASIVGTP